MNSDTCACYSLRQITVSLASDDSMLCILPCVPLLQVRQAPLVRDSLA